MTFENHTIAKLQCNENLRQALTNLSLAVVVLQHQHFVYAVVRTVFPLLLSHPHPF